MLLFFLDETEGLYFGARQNVQSLGGAVASLRGQVMRQPTTDSALFEFPLRDAVGLASCLSLVFVVKMK